ncbi:MAG: lytic transglycosylase domain-containing protein [Rhodospirillum sp.]|nr:lytic transglycosylase domain-containing protein [Rhodospirillum sp.]MCF8487529.1 lytic transglycosylase domain-containing protein [Rhodospirillum sp.]MCF8502419.1 lytic transglycosylase domain-containing protein [Rhodospirillum sp.]
MAIPLSARFSSQAGAAQVAAAQAAGDVLSSNDRTLYAQVFEVQEQGDWKTADKLIAQISDPVLMGHVTFQRLMHPTAYRAKGSELKTWLDAYADHPGADRIHRLASRRTSEPLVDPEEDFLSGIGDGGTGGTGWRLEGDYSQGSRTAATRHWRKFLQALNRGQTLVIKELVDAVGIQALAPIDADRMKAGLAYAYFVDGRDDWAIQWAEEAAKRSGDRVPLANWAAGLAHFRAEEYAKAAPFLEAVARAPHASSWLRAGGAYWAARAHLRNRHPEKSTPLLERAAAVPRSFYGMVAVRALGRPLPFDFSDGVASTEAYARVIATAAGKRALALVQVGRLEDAAEEFRSLYPGAGPELRRHVVAVAAAKGMPQVALRISGLDASSGDVARYPLAPWSPTEGWRVDPALIHAFARQESGFNPRATSGAGAKGLMQLMPATAAHVAGDHSLKTPGGGQRLYQPDYSLSLGQRYLNELLTSGQIQGNLFFLAAAYNSGPGRLHGWLRANRFKDDPLMFIESISSRESRIFIEKVLSNYWAYRARMKKPTPTLDAVAAGDWPLYMETQQVSSTFTP